MSVIFSLSCILHITRCASHNRISSQIFFPYIFPGSFFRERVWEAGGCVIRREFFQTPRTSTVDMWEV